MPCPTCSRTLQSVGQTTDGRRLWHCSTCGTLRCEAGKHADTYVPAIIGRAMAVVNLIDREYSSPWPAVRALREAATGQPDPAPEAIP